MKNRITRASLALLLTLQPAALMQAQARPQQASRQELFDSKKSSRDLEVMKGIIRTTLGFVTEEIRGSQPAGTRGQYSRVVGEYFGSSSIAAYYLVGQGAIFTIPASSLSSAANAYFEGNEFYLSAFNDQLAAQADQITKQTAELQLQAARIAAEASSAALAGQPVPPMPAVVAVAPVTAAQSPTPAPEPQPRGRTSGSGSGSGVGGGIGSGVGGGIGGGVPGGVVGGVAQGKIGSTGVNDEKIKQKIASAQERVKKQQESLEQRRAKFNESLAQFKAALIEALASHGDTLSQVKPNEYITIIISEDNRLLQQSQVLSLQKSVIADYKAGRTSLEALRAKVLDYSTEE